MRVDLLTIFPGLFESPLRQSLLGKAIEAGLLDVRVHDIRDHASDPHRKVDDTAYGGGPGMVMTAEPVFDAVESLGPGAKRRDPAVAGRPAARPARSSASWRPSRGWC